MAADHATAGKNELASYPERDPVVGSNKDTNEQITHIHTHTRVKFKSRVQT